MADTSAKISKLRSSLQSVGALIDRDFVAVTSMNAKDGAKVEVRRASVAVTIDEVTTRAYGVVFEKVASGGSDSEVQYLDYEELCACVTVLQQIADKVKEFSTRSIQNREIYFSASEGFKIGFFQQDKTQTGFMEFCSDEASIVTFEISYFLTIRDKLRMAQGQLRGLVAISEQGSVQNDSE